MQLVPTCHCKWNECRGVWHAQHFWHISHLYTSIQAHETIHVVIAGSPAAILARQQKLAGTARRQLQMSHFASPNPASLGAPEPESRSGVQVQSRVTDKHSHAQQHMMELPNIEQASQHDAQSEDGEIFPAAEPEVAAEAAASPDLTDAAPDSAFGNAAGIDSAQQLAGDRHAVGSVLAQGATAGVSFAAMTGADAESTAVSVHEQLGTDQSLGAIIQHTTAYVAGAHDADMPAALLLCDQVPKDSAEASAQQGAWHVRPAGSTTQEEYGMEYPWMEPTGGAAVSMASTEQLARAGAAGAVHPPHVTFATGGMASAAGSKIPMRYLAAAAADRRLAAEEASAAAAAECPVANGRSVVKTTAEAEAEAAGGTDAGNVMQGVVVSWAGREHVRQAPEQNWTQGDGADEQGQAPAALSLPGNTSSAFHPSCYILAESADTNHSLPRGVLGHAQEGGMEPISEGNEQSDAVSVTSFANSAASGLGHLLRAQQPWSESSSSPDRTSTTGSAEVRDISQLEAEVMSQLDSAHQPPHEVALPDEEVGLGSQLPMQLLLSHRQEQPLHAQPGLIGDPAQPMADDEQAQQQHVWHDADQAESQHDKAWSLALDASNAEAGTSVVGHATGKQTIPIR